MTDNSSSFKQTTTSQAADEPAKKAKPMLPSPELKAKANRWYAITVSAYAGLILMFLGLQFSDFDAKKLAMQTVPLFIFIPGMIKRTHRTFSWMCFVILIYFTAFVVEVGSPMFVWTDALGLTLSIVLFISAMMTSRWIQHWRYAEFLEQNQETR
ncbi:DUF2069 domain-containing protein [Marinibactrum halimedae]|uniref:DUF2069 domain-containing protein n=1 Tax=Marinibactrum halimedae TaxID=1444977 RepID=A0AA37WLW0_9GAMM|nr:DUF2069 domain-containing protein [Marinibactrum halimedae]MCD9457487.1 DUF2069 domain-containing protein [Marinibactrum halimedae]GLS25460.1 hypothetical protein GCM10007877_11740 [Marinibactrum halimedae]